MSFGFTTIADALSWAVALALAAKVVATVILLSSRPAPPRAAPALWWITKLTPVVAVALLIVLAARAHDREGLIIYTSLAVFVAVAVPWKVRRRWQT